MFTRLRCSIREASSESGRKRFNSRRLHQSRVRGTASPKARPRDEGGPPRTSPAELSPSPESALDTSHHRQPASPGCRQLADAMHKLAMMGFVRRGAPIDSHRVSNKAAEETGIPDGLNAPPTRSGWHGVLAAPMVGLDPRPLGELPETSTPVRLSRRSPPGDQPVGRETSRDPSGDSPFNRGDSMMLLHGLPKVRPGRARGDWSSTSTRER
jgi:hypothetical protein